MKLLKDMTEPELSRVMSTLGDQIKLTAMLLQVEAPLFALLLFNEVDQIAQYISTIQRPDMIKVLRETADRIERNQDVKR